VKFSGFATSRSSVRRRSPAASGIDRASVYRLLGKQAAGEANGGADADQG
jgi:hypothetical protein